MMPTYRDKCAVEEFGKGRVQRLRFALYGDIVILFEARAKVYRVKVIIVSAAPQNEVSSEHTLQNIVFVSVLVLV